MAEQQADHAKIRELARLGHAQAEGLATAGSGRIFQQTHGGIDGNAMFGGQQLSPAQTDGVQCIARVESQVLGDLQVVGQYSGANKLGHAWVFPGPMANGMSEATISSASTVEQLSRRRWNSRWPVPNLRGGGRNPASSVDYSDPAPTCGVFRPAVTAMKCRTICHQKKSA
ncbi:hypothetical protein D3C87_1317220 [compost metagenome]